jgi:hypothetical protein
MAEAIEAKDIMDELRALREDVTFIKKHMIDESIMNDEEYRKFQVAMKELESGRTTKSKDLKKQLGL